MTVEHARRLAEFMRGHARRLRTMDVSEAADEIGDFVMTLDKRLGVELAEDDGSDEREVIITAFSDPTAFDLVESLVAGTRDLPGWRFVRGAIALVVPTALASQVADAEASEELAWQQQRGAASPRAR